MHVKRTQKTSTEIVLTISAVSEDLEPIKQKVLKTLAKKVKVAGFREGKVPPQIAEKHVDPTVLQTEFLDEAMTQLYAQASESEKVRPVSQPKVDVKKFVPFDQLEFDVAAEVVGAVKLGEYKGLTSKAEIKKVTDKDQQNVIDNLLSRMSQRESVDRPAKTGDEVTIDFTGKKPDGASINGADGKDYPLILGSNAFIPGFEDNLIGLKASDEKEFTLTFPKEYGVKALAGQKVVFTVNIKTVSSLQKPELDDKFAASVGPFKNVEELREDIKKQLQSDAEQQNLRLKQGDLVEQIIDNSSVELPEVLVDQQLKFELDDFKRNLTYRGQTYEEFLAMESTTDEDYRKNVIRPAAERQVKVGIYLSEIAERENLEVSPEELEMQMQALKAQYKDPAMQAELEKPEARTDIASRILSQKVVDLIVENAG